MKTLEEKKKICGIPASLHYVGSAEEAAQRGTILFYHGLFSEKGRSSKECSHFARHGFLAIALDNYGHGEREDIDLLEKIKNTERVVAEKLFIAAVRATCAEIPELVKELKKLNLIANNRLGVCGISMGGYITYGAVLSEPSIKVATPILGSPFWGDSEEDSPHLHPESFYPVAILAQNGGADESVPPVHAREFNEELNKHYASNPDNLKYVEFPGAGHFMPEEDWHQLWKNIINWYENHFPVI